MVGGRKVKTVPQLRAVLGALPAGPFELWLRQVSEPCPGRRGPRLGAAEEGARRRGWVLQRRARGEGLLCLCLCLCVFNVTAFPLPSLPSHHLVPSLPAGLRPGPADAAGGPEEEKRAAAEEAAAGPQEDQEAEGARSAGK